MNQKTAASSKAVEDLLSEEMIEKLKKLVSNEEQQTKQLKEIEASNATLKKSNDSLIKRIKELEQEGSAGVSLALKSHPNFTEAFEKTRQGIYTPLRLKRLASPVQMTVSFRSSEDVVNKALLEVEKKFDAECAGEGGEIIYQEKVSEAVTEMGVASELREVTKRMNLYKASALRKKIYSLGYAWALYRLFERYDDKIEHMIDDTYGFTQKVISQLEREDDGPVSFFAEFATRITKDKNDLCPSENVLTKVVLRLRSQL